MGTKTFNNYEDLLTFTRASNGHALRPVSYGSELVTNGTFDTDATGWTDGGGANPTVSVSSGQAVVTATQTGSIVFEQTTTEFQAGKLYQIKVDVVTTTDNISVWNKASTSISIAGLSSGTNVINYVATEAGYLRIGNLGAVFSTGEGFTLDNVSVKEVTFDQPDGTLTLFEHPNNVPRVEWDADRNRLGLLVEEARTNLVTSSDATGWTVAAASATDNTETTLGAFTGAVVSSNGADWHRLRPANITAASGTTYVVTLFYEYGTSGNVLLNFRNGVGATESRITGAWGSLTIPYENAGTLTILEETALPQNVKKVVAKFVANFSGNFEIGIGPNSNTSGETVIAYAAQCEQASFGTSYIKTTGSTATRSADVASIPVADFGYNNKEITVMAEFIAPNWASSSTYHRLLSFDGKWGVFNDGSTASGKVRYRFDNDSNVAQFGAANLDTAIYGTSETMSKVAFALKNNDAAITKDGNTVVTDTSGDYDIELRTTLTIGAENASTNYLSGHLKTLKVYPRRLTDAQLQEITT